MIVECDEMRIANLVVMLVWKKSFEFYLDCNCQKGNGCEFDMIGSDSSECKRKEE